jgi:hypothetical protein
MVGAGHHRLASRFQKGVPPTAKTAETPSVTADQYQRLQHPLERHPCTLAPQAATARQHHDAVLGGDDAALDQDQPP